MYSDSYNKGTGMRQRGRLVVCSTLVIMWYVGTNWVELGEPSGC